MNNPFSGRFVLRLPSDLHAKLNRLALQGKQSLNTLCLNLIEEGLEGKRRKQVGSEKWKPLLRQLQQHFKSDLLGVLLFGSQVSGEATSSSDFDFLIVLDKKVSLTRTLYHWWDQQHFPVEEKASINPQFVQLPSIEENVGSLWLEVALFHEIIWEKNKQVSSFLKKVRALVERDDVRRYLRHGQPYWVWRNSEEQNAYH